MTKPLESPITETVRDTAGAIPATWCVVECMQGCRETWTVDTADFTPRLTAADVERMLTPLLVAHEALHSW